MSSVHDCTHLGLDVHRDTISVAVLPPGVETPEVDKLPHDEASVRRLIGRFPDRALLRSCYEAGPTGFGLHRLLTSMGVTNEVIAPSLIPKAPGESVAPKLVCLTRMSSHHNRQMRSLVGSVRDAQSTGR